MDALIGRKVRGYDIVEKIGEGGYGAIYRAYQPDVNREVAIKVILPHLALQAEFAQRFAVEAQLVAQLEHPYIVPLYDYWQDSEGAFLVMRWLRGGSLRKLLEVCGALSISQTARILDQLADALTFAHQCQIIHRDLKPANILVDDRDNVYLTDFGIAKSLKNRVDITDEGMLVGTPAYLSPEQCLSQPLTSLTDIYSLGIMLHEMLMGRHPFEGLPPGALVVKHLQDSLPLLQNSLPGFPDGLDNVIQKATAKQPAERYPDALAFAADFRLNARLTPTGSAIYPISAPIPEQRVSVIAADTPEQRNRNAMLQNVYTFWIDGVLENSLRETALIELGMSEKPDKIDHSWHLVRYLPDETVQEQRSASTSILKVWDKSNGKLLILGEPGSGKTTLLLELARDLIYRAQTDPSHPMPVVLNLSSWTSRFKTLDEWLVEELNQRYQIPLMMAHNWVKGDQLLLLLDGLDEVALARRDACVGTINTYRLEHGFVDVVICSRNYDYDLLPHKLKLNSAVMLQPLNEKKVDTYLTSLGSDMNSLRAALVEDAMLREMSHTPLMLSILVLVYRGHSAKELLPIQSVEARREHIFRRYVDLMMLRRHTSNQYDRKQLNHFLNWLARQMVRDSQSTFYIEGLQPAWLASDVERRLYAGMVTLYHGIGFGLLIGGLGWLLFDGATAVAFFLAAFLLSSICNLLEVRSLHITPVDAVQWSWKALRENLWQAWPIGLFFGVSGGLTWTVVANPGTGIVMGIFLGLAFMIMNKGFVSSQIGNKVTPNEGSFQALRNSWQPPLLIGSLAVPVLAPFVGFKPGIVTMIGLGLGGMLAGEPISKGGAMVVRHVVLRCLLYRSGAIPLNYARFLDDAAEHVLLHKLGGGYIFIHRLVLEYFANLDLT